MGDRFAAGTGVLAKIDNNQTLHCQSAGLWERPAMVAPMAFLRYVQELSKARSLSDDSAVFVAIIDSGGEANRTTLIEPGTTLIVGRHRKCELRLEHGNVALRHLAVHVAHTSKAKAPLLRVWDLSTGQAPTDEDGREVESLAADGPVFLSLGRYHLAIIPLRQLPKTLPVSTREAWAILPQRKFLSSMPAGTGTSLIPEVLGGPAGTSSITRMPSSITLHEITQTPVNSYEIVASVVIESPETQLKFTIGKEHLERGILVGRYDRCLGAGLSASVSRVHLLLASVDGAIVVIDTASTVGCKVDGVRIKTLQMQGSQKVRIGKHCYLRWQPSL